MLYKTNLTIPVTALFANPETVSMKLCEGHITRAFVQFPAGCAGLIWVQVWLNGYQLIPWERGQWLRGDDHIIEDHGRYSVSEEPRLLTVKGYGVDCLYPHTVQVAVEVSSPVGEAALVPAGDLLAELELW